MQPGTQQDQRLDAPLRPGYFAPDEFSIGERLRLLLAQAAILRFQLPTGGTAAAASSPGPAPHPGECWDDALQRDETIALADIAAFPLERELNAFLADLAWAPERELWLRLQQMIERFDAWQQQMARHDTPGAIHLSRSLQEQIEQRLQPLLQEALAIFGDSASPPRLRAFWAADGRLPPAPPTPPPESAARLLLRRLAIALHQAIHSVRRDALAQIENSLRSGRHDPAMSLLLAGLQLFQYSRAPLNRFPDRLTDFYYHDVLRMQPRRPGTERAYLLLEREPRHEAPIWIAPGTRFSGGKDGQGRAIEFAADYGLGLTDTRVSALYSLRLERDAQTSPEREYGYATRALVDTVPLLKPEAADTAQAPWWPLFGGRAKTSAAEPQDAVFGLAIASPLLALREGQRNLRVQLHLAHPADSDETLKNLLKIPAAQRDTDWLGAVFTRLDAHERSRHPPRPGAQGLASEPSVAALLARAAAPLDGAPPAAEHKQAPGAGDVQLRYLLLRCLLSDDVDSFAARLGRLFATWLVAPREDLQDDDLAALRAHARRLYVDSEGDREAGSDHVDLDNPLSLIFSDKPLERALVFNRVFRGVWQARLSTAQGWLTLREVFVQRGATQGIGEFGGSIEIVLRIGPEHPPLSACKAAVHGERWPAQALLQLQLQNQTRLYTYSLLQQYSLQGIGLDVEVDGLRELVLHNQLGRLDPSKPFQAFGPLPEAGAYLVFGSAELAGKPLRELELQLRWAAHPIFDSGFREHYRGYPGHWHADAFRVRPSILRDGRWQVTDGATQALFTVLDDDDERPLARQQSLHFGDNDLRRYHRSQSLVATPFEFGLHSRNGFFRLDFCEPPQGFGHALYPQQLSAVLARNARYKRQTALPREPYTPSIEHLAVRYRASQLIRLDSIDSSGDDDCGVYHLHAFGIDALHHSDQQALPPLLPSYAHDGNLYIGLDGSDLQGALNLYFHLYKEAAAERWSDSRPTLHWDVWTSNGWTALGTDQQLFDTSQGLLCSGLIGLNLPGSLSDDCPYLPGRHYWLRLSSDWGFEFHAGLHGVYAQALGVTRCQPAGPDEAPEPLPPGTLRQAQPSIAGLRRVLQIGPSYGRLAADPAELLRTRSAERLRHKNRACTAWDYERILLDAYPELYKVKCFTHLQLPQQARYGQPAKRLINDGAGHVLVVVVPAPRYGQLFDSCEGPRLDMATLERMATTLRDRAPPSAHIVVRNAAYERVQVRARVQLRRGRHPGAALRKINQTLIEYLSPWHTDGYEARFDWEVRAEELETHLRNLDAIEAVGALSLLHIVRSDQNLYVLGDTARAHDPNGSHIIPGRDSDDSRRLRPRLAWSLLLPTRRHLIRLYDNLQDNAPQATGVNGLEIGNTFIIGRGNDH